MKKTKTKLVARKQQKQKEMTRVAWIFRMIMTIQTVVYKQDNRSGFLDNNLGDTRRLMCW